MGWKLDNNDYRSRLGATLRKLQCIKSDISVFFQQYLADRRDGYVL